MTPSALDSIRIDICLARILTCNCSVYFSISAADVLVIVALFDPPSDVTVLYQEPELVNVFKVIVTTGLSAVEPSKVISGIILLTNEN